LVGAHLRIVERIESAHDIERRLVIDANDTARMDRLREAAGSPTEDRSDVGFRFSRCSKGCGRWALRRSCEFATDGTGSDRDRFVWALPCRREQQHHRTDLAGNTIPQEPNGIVCPDTSPT
jgi:hypothetical protein